MWRGTVRSASRRVGGQGEVSSARGSQALVAIQRQRRRAFAVYARSSESARSPIAARWRQVRVHVSRVHRAGLSDSWTRLEGIITDVEDTPVNAPSDTEEVVFPNVYFVPCGSVVWCYTHLYGAFGHAGAPRLDADLVAKAKRKLEATGAGKDTVNFSLRVVQYAGVDVRDPLADIGPRAG